MKRFTRYIQMQNKAPIIAIDPGYDRCGVAILTEEGSRLVVLFSTCITTNKTDAQETRLAFIFKGIEKLVKEYRPSHMALETLFFSVNKKTALKVAEARGAILLLSGLYNMPLIEISPQAVKIALTGVGNASKEQVQKMVSLTISNTKKGTLDDEVDAIALGVAGIQEIKQQNLGKGIAK